VNLTKLFDKQKVLDDRIMKEHPYLIGQENLSWKVLALQVELGECANEWRGFKKWSKNQQPKRCMHTTEGATIENAVFFQCGDDDCGERFNKGDARLNDIFGKNEEDCPICTEGYLYAFREKNPLLEEYVDCLHFIMSIGLEKGYHSMTHNLSATEGMKRNDVITQFNYLFDKVGDFSSIPNHNNYMYIIPLFFGLGEMLGFTWEQIEQAYIAKNEVNHKRQESGY